MTGNSVWTPTGETFLWILLVIDVAVLAAAFALDRRRGR